MSIVKGPWVEYHPVSSITDEGPIEFNVSGTSEEYLDLSQTMLQVTVKVTNNDNTALPADAPVGPVNLFLPSLFAQVDIMLNEKLVSQPSNTYPYRAYIESLLQYGGETKESQLTQQLYYKDKAGKMDVVNPLASSGEANPGLAKRHGFIVENKRININREEYCEGYTLFAFDLTPDLSDGCHLNLIKQGNMRLELQFDVAIPNTVNCIVYSEGQGLIQIDKSRNIIYDYQ
ncbi:uncharacterized protein F54H12.2-like [Diadema setosum]|uniref:uncharacterized protein F54H12.2-like n=1 Tax=Diadema setosum TaxID=31175 RepID=UPI003B3B3DB4